MISKIKTPFFIKRLTVLALTAVLTMLILAGCTLIPSKDVIGFFFIADTEEQSVIAVSHFDSNEQAKAFYQEQNVQKYYIFATTKGTAQDVFDTLEGSRDATNVILTTLTGFGGFSDPQQNVKAFIDYYHLVNVQ